MTYRPTCTRLVHLLDSVAERDCADEPIRWDDTRQCPDLYPGQNPEGWCEPCQARACLADLRELVEERDTAPETAEEWLARVTGAIRFTPQPELEAALRRAFAGRSA